MDSLELVKAYTGTVVSDVARALAVIAITTRPDPSDKITEATKTALRVTEAARLLCAIHPEIPIEYLSDEEQANLRLYFDNFTPPAEENDDGPEHK